MYHNLTFFDYEVYPEWWCVSLSKEEQDYPGKPYKYEFTEEDEKRIKDKMITFRSDNFNADEYKQFKELVDNAILCGYNIKHYDLQILQGVLKGYTPTQLFMLSQSIIEKDNYKYSILHNRLYNDCKWGYRKSVSYQDLYDDNDKSLKDKECSLGIDIRETTVPFDKKDLTEQEKQEIIFYNKHDVYALHVYYQCACKVYIDSKILLCSIFNMSVTEGYKCTNPKLVGKLLGAERFHGSKIIDPTLILRDKKLEDYFEKYLPKNIYNYLLTHTENLEFELFDNLVSIGDGGLHSVYMTPNVGTTNNYIPAPLYVESTDKWAMLNIDVSSFYPSIMIYCNAMSRAIKDPSKFISIYTTRIQLKDKKARTGLTEDESNFVAAAKLPLNGAYGAMGNEYLDMYDDYMRSKVCRVGQMILIALTNRLFTEVPELKVIQTNTDGVLVYVKREYQKQVEDIVNQFTEMSKFLFEIEEDNKLWQLNVNNYVAEHSDGSIKDKGGAFKSTIYNKGINKLAPLSNFCITKAIKDFYVKKENPLINILTNNVVNDFVLTCTKGPTYYGMFQEVNGQKIALGRVARVIAVKNEELGIVTKEGINKRETKNRKIGDIKTDTIPQCPPHALVVNDALSNYRIENKTLYHKDGRSWKIDYAYYAGILNDQLNDNKMIWYKMKDDTFEETNEFNF